MRKFFYENSLTLVLVVITLLSLVGIALSGWHEFNDQQREYGQPAVPLTQYLLTGDFAEAIFENWESEFLQLAAYVVLTIFFRQKGAVDSKSVDGSPEEVDREPDPNRPGAPGPVRRGGWVLWLYEKSLTIALVSLFMVSFLLHAWGGARAHNYEQQLKGKPERETTWSFMGTSEFWEQSFENWQSEFMSIGTLVVLSIFLRQKGSPESKPVDAPHDETGE